MSTSQPLHGLDIFSDIIEKAVAEALEVHPEEIKLERPRQESFGEFALPCFRFAKKYNISPPELAQQLTESLNINEITTSNVGPFLNFQINQKALAKKIIESAQQPKYGSAQEGKTTIVEFSSPNIAKPMHVGHMRTTVIGAALSRIFSHLGHNVKKINHLGDWGSQFGKLVTAWNRWGDEKKISDSPINHLLELYVKYHNEEDGDPTLKDEAKKIFKELESGENNKTRETWKRFTELSLIEFQRIYKIFDIEFDYLRGESWYESDLENLITWLKEKNVTTISEGALIVDLNPEGIKTPALIKTAHNTTLYITRDLAAAKSRWEEFKFDQSLYVVGAEQTLHFQQLIAVLKKCKVGWESKMEHVPFGLIRLNEGKLSTRQGRVITLYEVIEKAIGLAKTSIKAKNPSLENQEDVAKQIGVGAVVFHDLKHQRQKNVIFNWDEVLSFEGDTGPYLQYTHARCCSILRKSNFQPSKLSEADIEDLAKNSELWVAIGRLPNNLKEAAEKREPMILAHALLKIAAAGNGFYRDNKVIGAGSEKLEKSRLLAIDTLRKTLELGMQLLGVPAPKQM